MIQDLTTKQRILIYNEVKNLRNEVGRWLREKSFGEYLAQCRQIGEKNHTCPLCREHKIVNKIGLVRGGIEGRLDQSYGLLGGGSIHASIEGSVDTYPVLHCRECGNEWLSEQKPSYDDYNPDTLYSHKEVSQKACSQMTDILTQWKHHRKNLTDYKQKLQLIKVGSVERRNFLTEYHVETVIKVVREHMSEMDTGWGIFLKDEVGCKSLEKPQSPRQLTKRVSSLVGYWGYVIKDYLFL